jgi:hypothetical protein
MMFFDERREGPQDGHEDACNAVSQAAAQRGIDRRGFIGRAIAAAGAFGLPSLIQTNDAAAAPADGSPASLRRRREEAYQVRLQAARQQRSVPIPAHPTSGDEARYPSRIGSFSKGLPHDPVRGEVDPRAYDLFLRAARSGRPEDFERIPLGCPEPARQLKLANPQAGLSFELQGTDSHQLYMPAAPAFSSAEQAGEIVENYWMALLRDVPFTEYATNELALEAAEDLSALSDFKGPKAGGAVTPSTLFRGLFPGDLTGPYISQFLWQDAPFGAELLVRKVRTTAAGVDHMTSFPDWLAIQNGCAAAPDRFEPVQRYIINGRDLGQWVHIDVIAQAFEIASLLLLKFRAPTTLTNPYRTSSNQAGFVTFGVGFIRSLVSYVAMSALKAVWYHKWFVHRRARPEAVAARVHLAEARGAPYPLHPDVFDSSVLGHIFSHNQDQNGGPGTFLLPMAFPEGSPLHPAYGAGHAAIAGACTTVLKALFDESFPIPSPVVPRPEDPTQLMPYAGPGVLTVGGELNKLASNVALGRDLAGVHWRTDSLEGLLLGEAVAISALQDHKLTFNEAFTGFRFTSFDGSTVSIRG